MILDKIDELLKEVQTLSAQNAEEVEQLRLKYLSKKGEITALMNDFRTVAADQKKTVGMKINELKQLATEIREAGYVAPMILGTSTIPRRNEWWYSTLFGNYAKQRYDDN